MVYSGAPEERVVAETMAMGSERAKPLHNFSLPWDLKWGNQRHLRCMKVSSDGERSGSGADRQSSATRMMTTARRRETEFDRARRFRGARIESSSAAVAKEEEGIEAVMEKLMFDLKAEADKMKYAIFKEGEAATAAVAAAEDEDEDVEMAEVGESSPSPAVAAADVRPWNLRMRWAASKAPIFASDGASGADGVKGLRIEERKANYSPMRSEAATNGGSARGGASGSGSGSGSGQEKERPKFSVSLTKKEIEDDFMVILGHRPPLCPKRRPRNVQKQIDTPLQTLFSGMWLTEVSTKNYKVPEFPETAKVQRR